MDDPGHICVFLKPPIAGQVKTRLIPVLGAELAATLAEAMFRDTWCQIRNLPWAKPVVAAAGTIPANGQLGDDIEVWPQGEGDLGARLERILRKGLESSPFTMAVGADTPGLPNALLERARVELKSADAVIGPASDGGFYLLGLRGCRLNLLTGIPWSQTCTFAHTVRRLLETGLKVRVLDPWFDVDRPEDLERLKNFLASNPSAAPETARLLATIHLPAILPTSPASDVHPRVSAIIPTLNELDQLPVTLARLQALNLAEEIVVVDGGSSDGTQEWLATQMSFQVVNSAPGRGPQLNAGARESHGDVLLFLHADCWLPDDALARIGRALGSRRVAGGAFHIRFAEERPRFLRIVAGGINLRSDLCRCGTGDQAIFVRRDVIEAVGGFPNWPLFEDVDLVRRIKRKGYFAIISSPVAISARRYLTFGILRTILTMYALRVGYWMGISPFALKKWFRDFRGHVGRDGTTEPQRESAEQSNAAHADHLR